ncbi:hypothetical protein [Mycobacterium sp. IS-836]|uniref:hypothetical protein n=1 Tax=Mycobacterium sp. IS-836 TaxID=1834160 RepID=UPI0013010626|nr:hypothetical protein [Mycobacterium sp. IS-836]
MIWLIVGLVGVGLIILGHVAEGWQVEPVDDDQPEPDETPTEVLDWNGDPIVDLDL